MIKPEIRKLLASAKDEERGLTPREIAAVINSIPAEERTARTEILAAVNGTFGPDAPETRVAISDAFKRMESRAADADDDAARIAREAEARSLAARAGGLWTPGDRRSEGDEWRVLMPSLNEYRTATSGSTAVSGGYTVNTEMSRKYAALLAAKSTFMRALPADNILTFESDKLQVPRLTSSTGEDYVPELGIIPEGDMTWDSFTFAAKKIGKIQWASVEVLEDSAYDLRNIIGQNLILDASRRFDADAFTGGLTGEVKGIVAQGVTTTLSAGNVTVKYDDLADAVARIEAINGSPSVIWCSTDQAAALRKEKASGSGQYQGGNPVDSPASTAWGLPILVSGHLPAKTVVVADASRLYVGIRRNATVKISEDARFDSDQVGFKLTMRVAGVGVAESASVQIVKAAAS